MKAWVNPPANHVPDFDQSGVPTIVQNSAGFTDWVQQKVDFGAPVGAVKWCYFGGDADIIDDRSRGLVNRLGFSLPVTIGEVDRGSRAIAMP